MSVGRHGMIRLCDPSVSRDHAELTSNGENWLVTDLGSRNGTYVNGVAVQRRRILPGDTVRFGKVSLRFDGGLANDEDYDEETRAITVSPQTMTLDGPGAQALVGQSAALRDAMRLAARAAHSNATVLLYGESGTGKELFARLVWEESSRKDKVFVPVHSGAIEPSLLASTLFGYEKGAFTGADRQKNGLFEDANGGTIFLDEIGELPLDLQVKLLRVIQSRAFEKVGSSHTISVDVRIVAATNRDIEKMVQEGTFRSDLYYRLNVLPITVPPLRQRKEDIEPLANFFRNRFSAETKKNFVGFSQDAIDLLYSYYWPGNIRELENTVERACVLGKPPYIHAADLRLNSKVSGDEPRSTEIAVVQDDGDRTLKTMITKFKKSYVIKILEETNWNQTEAGKILGIQRTYVSRLMNELGIR